MSNYQRQYVQALQAQSNFFRLTSKGNAPGAAQQVMSLSRYLYDVFEMCANGIGELELRQFMPPASLQASVSSLLELGFIEIVDRAQRNTAVLPRDAANRHAFFDSGRMAA